MGLFIWFVSSHESVYELACDRFHLSYCYHISLLPPHFHLLRPVHRIFCAHIYKVVPIFQVLPLGCIKANQPNTVNTETKKKKKRADWKVDNKLLQMDYHLKNFGYASKLDAKTVEP